MKQYIDKDALVAEIEKRLNYRNKGLDAINNGTFWDEEQSEDTFNEALTTCAYNAVKNELFELKCFLDIVETIEVKEVENAELLNVKGYLVRDKDDYTAIYAEKPHKGKTEWVDDNNSCLMIIYDARLAPDIEFENEPIEVEVALKRLNTRE